MSEKFLQWLVQSSADPDKVALTVKGFLGVMISVILAISPLLHLRLEQGQLEMAGNLVVEVLVISLGIVSSLATIWGIVRKFVNLFKKPSA